MAEKADRPAELDPGRDVWERLSSDDPVAPSDLAELFLDPLSNWLDDHNPPIDSQMCATAAEDAILALIKNPATYKPERQTLEVYLRISASGDLKNLLRTEQRHRERRADWESVELSPVVGKYLQDPSEDPSVVLEEREEAAEARTVALAVLDGVRQELDQESSIVLDLLLADQRKTAVYARALGLDDEPPAEQERLVKRAKDRVKKRILRARDHHD